MTRPVWNIFSFSEVMAVFLALGIFSCYDPPPLKLTSAQRTEVDTLYMRVITPLSAQLDAACEADREKKIQALIDSMIAVRATEEESLRKKFQFDGGK